MKKVRVFFSCSARLLLQETERILGTVSETIDIVSEPTEAELIISDSMEIIEELYTTGKYYVYLQPKPRTGRLHPPRTNVTSINVTSETMMRLLAIVEEVKTRVPQP